MEVREVAVSKPISVGDLVVVVRGTKCCGAGRHVGKIFKVTGFIDQGYIACSACGRVRSVQLRTAFGISIHPGYDVNRLKRIPPLSELEGERTEEKLHEPT